MSFDFIKKVFNRGPETQKEPRLPSRTTAEAPTSGLLAKMGGGIARSAASIRQKLSFLVGGQTVDAHVVEDIEDVLLQADFGPDLSMNIVEKLTRHRSDRKIDVEDALRIISDEVAATLRPLAKPLTIPKPDHGPHVILVVGVNGAGKTTTIGKIAARLSSAGQRVTLAAGDTFRAAADEQLRIWAERTGSDFVSGEGFKDGAAVAFAGYDKARNDGADALIIDTAGRLQNNHDLMAELEKTVRVLEKCAPGAPHTVIAVLDATVGHNANRQIEEFGKRVPITGIVMTKLDGTARGGILVSIGAKFRLPIHFIGVGESVDDLLDFDPDMFAASLVGNTMVSSTVVDQG